MKATPKIDRAGNLAPGAVEPIPGDGGVFLRCVSYGVPGQGGRDVDVFVPAAQIDALLLALRDKARDNRRADAATISASVPSPLLRAAAPPKARGPRVVVVEDPGGPDVLRDAADQAVRDFFNRGT